MAARSFLIILPEQSLEATSVAAERLRRGVEDLAMSHEANLPQGLVTISVGLAALPPGEKKPFEELLKEADDALYAAKEAGRNRIMVYNMPASALRLPASFEDLIS